MKKTIAIKTIAGLDVSVSLPVITRLEQTLKTNPAYVKDHFLSNPAHSHFLSTHVIANLELCIGNYRQQIILTNDVNRYHYSDKVIWGVKGVKGKTQGISSLVSCFRLHEIADSLFYANKNHVAECASESKALFLKESGITLDVDDSIALYQLIKEVTDYIDTHFVERDKEKMLYQCEGMDGEIILKRYTDLESWELIWGAIPNNRIENKLTPKSRGDYAIASALTLENIKILETQIALLNEQALAVCDEAALLKRTVPLDGDAENAQALITIKKQLNHLSDILIARLKLALVFQDKLEDVQVSNTTH